MQYQLNADLGQPRAKLWTKSGDAIIWTVISSALVGQWLYGWVRDQPLRMQMVSLMIEAMGVAQLYHLGIKLALGREGPDDGEGQGHIYGPGTRGFRLFPAGTPSGHAITAYAFLGVAVGFIEERWARVFLHLGALAFGASLVIDNYHFASDVIFGAAAGYAIGRWVARHRASVAIGDWYDDFVAVPYVDPWRQGAGLAVMFPLPI
jgi:membrane-associated phospholipid phosphatase